MIFRTGKFAASPESWFCRRSRRLALSDEAASQIVEFAVSLPLLVVMVVGIFDFGNAFNLKHKLVNTAREAARFGSNQPMSDLSQGVSANSPVSIATLVGNYLQSQKLNDCGLAVNAAAGTGIGHPSNTLIWTFTSNTGCPGTLELDVNRGYTYQVPGPAGTNLLTIEATQVTLSYPYPWQFSNAFRLLGGNYSGVTQVTVVATMQNLN